jgi:hypothetical protein
MVESNCEYTLWDTCEYIKQVPVAERSKAEAYGRSLPGIAGSNSVGSIDVFLL